MSSSVQPRARHIKSTAKAPKCPACGSVLVTTRDDDALTTLTCPQCSRRSTAGWLAEPASYAVVRKLARLYRGLSCADADDLQQDIVVAVLEAKTAPADEAAFAVWLDATAKKVAGGLRDEFLSQPKAVDGEILAVTVAAREECELDTPEAWEAKEKADKARAARIRRALKKLSDQHREVIESRFFRGANLSAEAGADGGCDSRDRMRLLRAKAKLQTLIDANGYAMAA